MSIAISSQMAASLVQLTSTANDVGMTQNRLASGLAVASASDNIAVYFKAQSYNEKAEALDTTNKNISQGVANLDVVDKALSNMKDNIKGARSLLNDALAKAVVSGNPVTVNKNAAGAAVLQTGTTWGDYSGAAITTPRKGAIVDAGAAWTDSLGAAHTAAEHATTNSDKYFQVNDVFAVTFQDSSTGKPAQVAYFKAIDPTATVDNAATTGAAGNPYVFNDMESMANAMNAAFGRSNAAFTLQKNTTVVGPTTVNNYYMQMQLGSPTQQISFSQVSSTTGINDADVFDFRNLFGNQAQLGTNIGVQNSNGLQQTATAALTGLSNANTITYVSSTNTLADPTAVDARKQAADFFRQTLLGLSASVADAYLPGYANILKGDTMTVFLNESNTVKQDVKIPAGINFATRTAGNNGTPGAVGTAAFNVGLTATGSNDFTDTGAATQQNFLSDTQLRNAITALDNMNTTVGQYQKNLAASKVAMSSRLDFNKTVTTTLQQGAVAMTAADTNMEAANLAALQNRQSFAVNNMSITKQAEQSLLQVLR